MKLPGCIVGAVQFVVAAKVAGASERPGAFTEATASALAARFAVVRASVEAMIAAVPGFAASFAAALGGFAPPRGGPLGAGALLLALAATLALPIAAALAVRLATRRTRWRLAMPANDARARAGRAIAVLALEAIDRAAFALVAWVAVDLFLTPETAQGRLGVCMLTVAVKWWLAMLIVTALLRPAAPALRLLPVDDALARALARFAGVAVLTVEATVALLPLMVPLGLPVPAVQLTALAAGVAVAAWLGWRVANLALGPVARGTALAVGAVLWLAWSGGALLVDLSVFDALVESLAIVLVAYLIDALAGLSADRPLIGALRRCVRLVSVLVVARILVETWLVGQLELLTPEDWQRTSRAFVGAATVVLGGYLLWEALRFWLDGKFASRPGFTPGSAPGEDEVEAAPASRLVTLMPLFRVLIAITILVFTALVALSELGVNTAPLIAGASIFGLAISFGSQALVRDIVSGIFFIADDAFRIGEYIDTGKLKGTVEAISVRSVKLRHQNGQVHTIPFGQLLSVTNFSRDWATVKFNLRLVRDVDVERVRKTVKKIGQEMLADPELGRELIQPLKLQGVADVLDNAIVVRLKFTARPVKPNWVQREALKRIVRAFAESGIAFASNAVTVQTTAGPDPGTDPAHAAAAATVLPTKDVRTG
jgi:small-conductance mechanosensitive channel